MKTGSGSGDVNSSNDEAGSNCVLAADLKLRPLRCELNPLSRSHASAMFGQGATCMLVSLNGPLEVKLQNLNVDRATIECTYRTKIISLPSARDRVAETVVGESCEGALAIGLMPRTLIAVQVQELDDFGGRLACAINAACMACLVSGLPMQFTVAAVHCIVNNEGELLLDPDKQKMLDMRASFTFGFDSQEQQLVALYTRGVFSPTDFNAAEQLCRKASEIVFKFQRETIERYYKRSVHSSYSTDKVVTDDKQGDTNSDMEETIGIEEKFNRELR